MCVMLKLTIARTFFTCVYVWDVEGNGYYDFPHRCVCMGG